VIGNDERSNGELELIEPYVAAELEWIQCVVLARAVATSAQVLADASAELLDRLEQQAA
jgi:hypothetical protein